MSSSVTSRSSHEVTRTSSFEYEDVDIKKANSPPSSIEGDEYPYSVESERMLSGISMRSLRARVPWEKKGVYRHFIHFSHILSQSNMIKFPYFPFIFAYVSAYLFVGVPVLCVEMALGQFASVPPVELFRKMCPSLAGIGTVMLALLMFKAISMAADSTQAIFSALYTIREGLYYTPEDADWIEFFKFDLSPLASFGIWADAVGFVIVSLALGTGSVQKISSLSDFNENFFYNALITCAADM
uniref:Aa_trans domain-containing protein n=1 Tax=Meloidogyne hapla TaxID=6305 RepID=A0A1I8B877_MELHA